MTIEVLNNLIAKGQANYGTYVATGSLVSIVVPAEYGMIITGITLRSFADLPAGKSFLDYASVVTATWHQLRVIGRKGTNAFQARHELTQLTDAVGNKWIPKGFTHWDVFLNQEGTVIIELLNVGRAMLAALITEAPLPAELQIPNNPNPPFGYGKVGSVPAPLNALETLTVAATWQFRPFNKFTPSNPPGIDSRNQFVLPANATTRIQPPQLAIDYGTYTMPIIEVEYVMFRKKPEMTYSDPVAL